MKKEKLHEKSPKQLLINKEFGIFSTRTQDADMFAQDDRNRQSREKIRDTF